MAGYPHFLSSYVEWFQSKTNETFPKISHNFFSGLALKVALPVVIIVVLIVIVGVLIYCRNTRNRSGFKRGKNINSSEESGYHNPTYDFQENESSNDYTQLEKTIPLNTYTEVKPQPAYQEIVHDNNFKKEPIYSELEKES